jgi:GntR family transcriptional regulator
VTSDRRAAAHGDSQERCRAYYAQLGRAVSAEAITSGEEGCPGRPLPSEQVIGVFLRPVRTAVRQALAELSAEGLVRKEKGRGSFVRGPRRAEFVVQELRGFFDEMSEQGKAVTTDVLLLETTVAPAEEAALLGIPTGSKVVQLDRLRRVDGEPICLARTLLPLPRFAGLAGQDLSSSSLYEVLHSAFGVEPRTGWRTVEATAADRRTASLLGVRAGSPLLLLQSLNVDATGSRSSTSPRGTAPDRTSFRIEVGPAHTQRGRS